jgi:hypothetical protein
MMVDGTLEGCCATTGGAQHDRQADIAMSFFIETLLANAVCTQH